MANRIRSMRILKGFVILIGLAVCLVVVAPPAFVVFLHLKSESTIANTQQEEVNWIVAHAYPGSSMFRADGEVNNWPAGDGITVVVLVTFESKDSFDSVKNWYFQH